MAGDLMAGGLGGRKQAHGHTTLFHLQLGLKDFFPLAFHRVIF